VPELVRRSPPGGKACGRKENEREVTKKGDRVGRPWASKWGEEGNLRENKGHLHFEIGVAEGRETEAGAPVGSKFLGEEAGGSHAAHPRM